jgi:hypothetical protein
MLSLSSISGRVLPPALLLAATLAAAPVTAQQVLAGNPAAPNAKFESREHLKAQADLAEKQGRTSEAWLLRARLERGDFQEGDRIVVIIEGTTGASVDTLQVRGGKVLQFPRLGDLSVAGVLRSELSPAIRDFLSKYLQAPAVRTVPLLPVAVLGSVGTPGYYYTPADVVLRDIVMRAGGPSPSADLSRMVIRRGTEVIWKSDDVRIALADGLSLDALHLRAGDEVFVPERRRMDAQSIITMVSGGVAVIAAIVSFSR